MAGSLLADPAFCWTAHPRPPALGGGIFETEALDIPALWVQHLGQSLFRLSDLRRKARMAALPDIASAEADLEVQTHITEAVYRRVIGAKDRQLVERFLEDRLGSVSPERSLGSLETSSQARFYRLLAQATALLDEGGLPGNVATAPGRLEVALQYPSRLHDLGEAFFRANASYLDDLTLDDLRMLWNGSAFQIAGLMIQFEGSRILIREFPLREGPTPLIINHITPEVNPFSKTGGLGDVLEGLPLEQAYQGNVVNIFTICYDSVEAIAKNMNIPFEDTGVTMPIPIPKVKMDGWVHGPDYVEPARVFKAEVGTAGPGHNRVTVYLLKPNYAAGASSFLGSKVYTGEDGSYERFDQTMFLNKGAMDVMIAFGLRSDVIHGHDWQAGASGALVKEHPLYSRHPLFKDTITFFTHHNLAYQGVFTSEPRFLGPKMGIEESLWSKVFGWLGFEFLGKANLMKGGIQFSDGVSTVSPTYRTETLTRRWGYGLEAALKAKGKLYFGIINGLDTDRWDPATDPYLKVKGFTNYSLADTNLFEEKAQNKMALQRISHLTVDPTAPVLSAIVRFVPQKGVVLLGDHAQNIGALRQNLISHPKAQFILWLLGSEIDSLSETAESLRQLEREFPGRVYLKLQSQSDWEYSSQVYAGSDFLLIPSEFEPSGLIQLIGYRYGVIPIAREVGGLRDTIHDFIRSVIPTGFLFEDFTAEALSGAIQRALALYENKTEFTAMVMRVMALDVSWKKSAQTYRDAYQKTAATAGKWLWRPHLTALRTAA